MIRTTFKIIIRGRVQGVGFRPFVFKLARRMNLLGWVRNDNAGLTIHINAKDDELEAFVKAIECWAPRVSHIESVCVNKVEPEIYTDFRIVESSDYSSDITGISPDIAVCKNCLLDLQQQDHRINYPLINCTNCGPRFSIIRSMPYDRENTTMADFQMCEQCRSEYSNVIDRRFHAQPVACNKCGPNYQMQIEKSLIRDTSTILSLAADTIHSGGIIAIKGTGGYHLACSAIDHFAVSKLRQRKFREARPFAVMFKDIATLEDFAVVTDVEKEQLQSSSRPIVLLQKKRDLAASVTNGLNTIGAMLPYMPFHFMLFKLLSVPAIVLTSGNISKEPVIISDKEADSKLLPIADALISYNREIYNRTDDSVIFVVNRRGHLLRRSRGFVPNVLYMDNIDVNNILAVGGELKNTFCIGKGNQAIMSQYIGDIENLETSDFFESNLKRFKELYRITPQLVACDMHPDYFTSRLARSMELPLIEIQHHHAHIASVMAEHHLDEKVIGISMDGTGYGDDGKIWGSEFMVCDLEDYRRIFHMQEIGLPGGEKAIKEPWRIALYLLSKIEGDSLDMDRHLFLSNIPKGDKEIVLQSILRDLNCPKSCGAGRLFDAVSALLNICTHNRYEAEAPMLLESVICPAITDSYPISIKEIIPTDSIIDNILEDLRNNVSTGVIAARFHNSIIQLILKGAREIRSQKSISKVILSGGVFQNRYILERTELTLKEHGFSVYTNMEYPMNDGGISLGQLAIAAKRRNSICV